MLHGLAALEADLGVDSRVDAQLATQLAYVAERREDYSYSHGARSYPTHTFFSQV